jgi:hypothetical protein
LFWLSKIWAAIFVRRLINLISKFETHCNKFLIDEIIEHNSEVPWGLALMASTTILESLSNTIFDHPLEMASRIASKIIIAPPSATLRLCLQLLVHAAIKVPIEWRTHQLHPVKLGCCEKLASILHFHLPSRGRCHYNISIVHT